MCLGNTTTHSPPSWHSSGPLTAKLSVVEFKEPDYSVSKKQTPTLKFGHSLAREPLLPFEASPEMLVDWGKLAHATYMHNPQPDFLDKIHGRDVTRRSPSMHAQIDVIPNDELEVKSIHTSRDFLLLPGIPLAITASSRHPQTALGFPGPALVLDFPHADRLIAAHGQSFRYNPHYQHTLNVPENAPNILRKASGEYSACMLHFTYNYSAMNEAINEMIKSRQYRPSSRLRPFYENELESVYARSNFPEEYLVRVGRLKSRSLKMETVVKKDIPDPLTNTRTDARRAAVSH